VKFSQVSPDCLFEEIFELMSREELKALLIECKGLASALGINLQLLSRFGMLKTQFSCPRPFQSLYINFDGTIAGCNQQLSNWPVSGFSKRKLFRSLNSPGFVALRNSVGKPFQNYLCAWCYNNRVE
jgi:hypothetical protein